MNLLNYFTTKGFDCDTREDCIVVRLTGKNGLEITPELDVCLQSNDGFSITLGRFADAEAIWSLLNILGKANA